MPESVGAMTINKVCGSGLKAVMLAAQAVAWGDYDNDGDLDLFITNGEGTSTGPYVLLQNGGNANHWLKLKLKGREAATPPQDEPEADEAPVDEPKPPPTPKRRTL